MNEKAHAILDMAMKISQNTPTDVSFDYISGANMLSIRIYPDGVTKSNHEYYYANLEYEPFGEHEIIPDEMLDKLEGIWQDFLKKEKIA